MGSQCRAGVWGCWIPYLRPDAQGCLEAVEGLVVLACQVKEYTKATLHVRIDVLTWPLIGSSQVEVLHLLDQCSGVRERRQDS